MSGWLSWRKEEEEENKGGGKEWEEEEEGKRKKGKRRGKKGRRGKRRRESGRGGTGEKVITSLKLWERPQRVRYEGHHWLSTVTNVLGIFLRLPGWALRELRGGETQFVPLEARSSHRDLRPGESASRRKWGWRGRFEASKVPMP